MPAFEGPAVWAAVGMFILMLLTILYFILHPEEKKASKESSHLHHRIGEVVYRYTGDAGLNDKRVRSFWTQRAYHQMSQYVLLVTDMTSGNSLSKPVDGANAYIAAEEQMHQNLISRGYEIEGDRVTLDLALDPEKKPATGEVIHKEKDRDENAEELARIFG